MIQKEERLFRLLGQLDPALIEAADTEEGSRDTTVPKSPATHAATATSKKSSLLCPLPGKYLVPAAALLLLLSLTGLTIYHTSHPHVQAPDPQAPAFLSTAIDNSLPLLSITLREDGEALGQDVVYAYDIRDLPDTNPWTEDLELTSLPVYQNMAPIDGAGVLLHPDWNLMENMLLETAHAHGITDLVYTRETVNYPPFVTGKADNLTLRMDHPRETEINFTDGLELPTEYAIFYQAAAYDQAYQTGEYLLKQYPELFALTRPVIHISCSYTLAGEDLGKPGYRISYYEDSTDPVQKILNYNFDQTFLSFDSEGRLSRILIRQTDLSNLVGYYPSISVEDALLLLEQGYCFSKEGTPKSQQVPDSAYICKYELVYLCSNFEEYFIPYYCFYVENPEEKMDCGLRCYALYYVPAIDIRYFDN